MTRAVSEALRQAMAQSAGHRPGSAREMLEKLKDARKAPFHQNLNAASTLIVNPPVVEKPRAVGDKPRAEVHDPEPVAIPPTVAGPAERPAAATRTNYLLGILGGPTGTVLTVLMIFLLIILFIIVVNYGTS